MDAGGVVLVVVIWTGTGLLTGLWMARHGHDWRWTVIAVALGPIFVPVALDRVERAPRVASSGDDGSPAPRSGTRGARVLVGIDGSADADRALTTALALFGAQCGLVVLAEVVPYDTDTDGAPDRLEAAAGHVRAAASHVGGVPVNREVLAGPPGEALSRYAAEQDMDVVVVGRRGRGLTERLLGSVSAYLLRHAVVPVLVVEPEPTATGDARAPSPDRTRQDRP